jgi:hypothetical protein
MPWLLSSWRKIGDWMGLRASVDAMEKKGIFSPLRN